MWKLVFHQCTRYLPPSLTAFLPSCHSSCWYLNDAGSLTEVSAANWSKLSRLGAAFKWLLDTLALHCTRAPKRINLSAKSAVYSFYNKSILWQTARQQSEIRHACRLCLLYALFSVIHILAYPFSRLYRVYNKHTLARMYNRPIWRLTIQLIKWKEAPPRCSLLHILYTLYIHMYLSVGINAHLCISQMPSSY